VKLETETVASMHLIKEKIIKTGQKVVKIQTQLQNHVFYGSNNFRKDTKIIAQYYTRPCTFIHS